LCCELPDASQWLVYEPRFLDPSEPRGLWFCDGPEAVYAIQANAVCLAAGAGWDSLDRCRAFFQAFPYVLVVCPDGARREAMVQELRRRLDTPLLVAETEAFQGCATVAALKAAHGLKGLDRILLYSRELPAYGLLNLRDIAAPDVPHLPKLCSGLPGLDKITGGFFLGELSVWTGRRGSGKSTILSQLLLEAVDQGRTVCAYSGELPAWQFKHWAMLQAAGPGHVELRADRATGKEIPTVPAPVARLIDAWWDKHFFLDDLEAGDAHDEDKILRNFQYAVRRYGASVFLADNLMTARFRPGREGEYYRAQSAFVARLKAFARQYNVHVHLVAHPRKSPGNSGGEGRKAYRPDADEVGGSGDVTNLADNVFAMAQGPVEVPAPEGRETRQMPVLLVLKNRMYGGKGSLALGFHQDSKRFFQLPGGSPGKALGWELASRQLSLTEEQDGDAPL